MKRVPSSQGTFRIRFAKEDFRFSSAHFTIFSEEAAEALHGHNYQMWLELAGSHLGPHGLLLAFDPIKAAVRALCSELDGKILLPTLAPGLAVVRHDTEVDIAWRDRRYRFPVSEVVEVPLANTSIELLARFSWQRLVKVVSDSPCETLGVGVEETAGQSCFFEAPIRQ